MLAPLWLLIADCPHQAGGQGVSRTLSSEVSGTSSGRPASLPADPGAGLPHFCRRFLRDGAWAELSGDPAIDSRSVLGPRSSRGKLREGQRSCVGLVVMSEQGLWGPGHSAGRLPAQKQDRDVWAPPPPGTH